MADYIDTIEYESTQYELRDTTTAATVTELSGKVDTLNTTVENLNNTVPAQITALQNWQGSDYDTFATYTAAEKVITDNLQTQITNINPTQINAEIAALKNWQGTDYNTFATYVAAEKVITDNLQAQITGTGTTSVNSRLNEIEEWTGQNRTTVEYYSFPDFCQYFDSVEKDFESRITALEDAVFV